MQFPYNTVRERVKSIGERVRAFIAERRDMFARLAELMLIAAIFFGLGILYAEHMPAKTMPLSIEIPAQVKNTASIVSASASTTADIAQKQTASSEKGAYMASKNGSKYYLVTCKSTIKEANKVYFTTKEDAEKAGFSPSATCFK